MQSRKPNGTITDIVLEVSKKNTCRLSFLNFESGTHARTQGVVKGELVVGELPPHLAQSLFSKPAKYPIAMRYSTEPGDPSLDDRIPQPRGLGMKVFNVPGEMFEVNPAPTQDIEFNSTPALDLADAKTTRDIIDLRIKYGSDKKELYKHLEARKDTDLQKARDQVRNTHLEVCFSALFKLCLPVHKSL